MLKLKIEEEKNIMNNNQIILFDEPKYIYISLKRKNETFLPVIKKGDYVYQEEKIARRKIDHFPVFSTVSGITIVVNGNEIIIQNDFKNRIRNYQILEHNISKYNKAEITQLLFDLGVTNIGVDEIDPYQKLSYNAGYKYLMINALREEPYVNIESFQLKLERKSLLEIIDAFIEIYNFEEILIVVPSDQKILLEEWKNDIKDLRIKFVELEEYYAFTNQRKLIWKLKKIKYRENPFEKGITIFNISTMLFMYQALKYQRPKTKMLVQFTGNMWKNNCYMEVRIGSYLKEALNFLEFKRTKEVALLSGGPMKGKSKKIENTVIDVKTPVYSAWRAQIEKYHSESCIRCGKCTKVCPSNLNPVLIMDAIIKKRKLHRFHIHDCTECGLCSYVCPSNILISDMMIEAKEKVE